jgi:hypothetical protein
MSQFQIDDFEYHRSKKKLKETYKLDVMFQTDFLEETYKDFLYNGRDINKTMQS